MLANLASYMRNRAEETPKTILMELNKLSFYKPQGRIYPNELIRYALMQRYTSRQAYNLLLDEFHLPSIFHLKMLSKGGIEQIKALKLMMETGNVSADCVILVDETYLQKGVQYHGGSFIGLDDDGNLYSGVVVFMVVSLKESIPFVVKACPEFKITGEWLCCQMEETLETMCTSSFKVRAVITDNHATNVLAFKILRSKYGVEDNDLYFTFMENKIFNLYDSVHLMKNIRNNLLNAKRFVFPSFDFLEFEDAIHVDAGEISWHLLHNVHEKDEHLTGNLKKSFQIISCNFTSRK